MREREKSRIQKSFWPKNWKDELNLAEIGIPWEKQVLHERIRSSALSM